MALTLRQRIALTWLPQFVLLVVLGIAGAFVLRHLGGRIEDIMRENYRSVVYMKDLNEALERIDSSFHIALAGRALDAKEQYTEFWRKYDVNLEYEQQNITLPYEREYVEQLTALTTAYRERGDLFFASQGNREKQIEGYFNNNGLRDVFRNIKQVSDKIRQINQDNMLQVRDEARETARLSLWGFGLALSVGAALAIVLAVHLHRAILNQVRTMTESATAIGRGDLDQLVPALTPDELGELAQAFNTMARQLREYRQSQQSRLLRIQKSTQATVDAFPNPVLVLDAQGRVEMANPAANQILGAAPDGNGEASSAVWHAPTALRQPLHEAMHNQQAYLPEGFDHALPLRIGDQDRVYLPRLFPIRDSHGATLGVAVLLEDVTRFRLLDEVKSNLVATVSHELKTPLTSIRLAVHLLLEDTVGPLNPKQLELVLDARDNTERLLTMINNLLDLARHERGRQDLDVQLEQPATLLRTAADMVRPRAEDKGVELIVTLPPGLPAVSADPVRLGHALQNLLDNALAYTGRGGRITLEATANDNAVILSITDTGIGIPPEHLPHVFDRFFRVPGQSQAGGTGLGLAIVREIVIAHGGTIDCASRGGEGTVFRISLPARFDVPAKAMNHVTNESVTRKA